MSFQERFIEADGCHIRIMEAGQGAPLICLHGAGGLRLSRGHDLLAQHHRVVVMEMPGFGTSPENTRSATTRDLAATMAAAVQAMEIKTYDLMGTSFGGKVALWLTALHPDRVRAVVLEAPAAIRPPDARPSTGTPDEIARRVYAHPERMPPLTPVDPAIQAKQLALVMRSIGPARDAELEERMRGIETPVLVLFGTMDRRSSDRGGTAGGVYRGRNGFPDPARGVRYHAAKDDDFSLGDSCGCVVSVACLANPSISWSMRNGSARLRLPHPERRCHPSRPCRHPATSCRSH